MVESKLVRGPTSRSSFITNASVGFRLEKGVEYISGNLRLFWVIKGFLWHWLLHSSVVQILYRFCTQIIWRLISLSTHSAIKINITLSIYPRCELCATFVYIWDIILFQPFWLGASHFWGKVGHLSSIKQTKKQSRTCFSYGVFLVAVARSHNLFSNAWQWARVLFKWIERGMGVVFPQNFSFRIKRTKRVKF